MAKFIVGLTGQIACGKGTIKKYLMENYGAKDYRFSTILRDVLNRLHIPVERENLQSLSYVLRQKFGEDVLADAMLEDIKNDPHDVLVIDGIRRMTDIKHLHGKPNFFLIRVVSNEKIRYDRVVLRNENPGDAEKTFEDFLADQKRDAEQQIPEVMSNAQYEIINEGTIEQMHRKIDDIIQDIKTKII